MSRRFVLSAPAVNDLDEILEYVLVHSGPRRVLRVNERLHEAFGKLAETPGMGHVREDLADETLQAWPVFSYLVIYRPKSSPLDVVRVLHGARDLPAIFGSEDSEGV